MRIICIHQGVELYGSDRSFLQAVEGIRKRWPQAHIKVVLPGSGPLNERLATVADRVEVRSLGILRLAEPVKTLLKSTIGLPWYAGRALGDLLRADLLYVNTVVVADYIMASRFLPSRAVIHIREIPKPKAMPVFRLLCRASGAALIFNSRATARAFDYGSSVKQAVIHNGVDRVAGAAPPDLPDRFSVGRPLRIAMLGRINNWKGQDLLVQACGLLSPEDRGRVRIRIVGGTFGGTATPIDQLKDLITQSGLEQAVSLEPFQDDPGTVYRWADLCAVPSRHPEPFGRVAIEAMAHGRPVIAAAHGGLVEIVDEQSGWLFAANDAEALAAAIRAALDRPERLYDKARGALLRFDGNFSADVMQDRLAERLAGWIAKARPHAEKRT